MSEDCKDYLECMLVYVDSLEAECATARAVDQGGSWEITPDPKMDLTM
jgi:hypothetical protein